MIDFDMMLVHVGEFGLYQKILFLFQAPFCIFVTFVLFGQLFIYLYPRVYWCQMGPCVNDLNLSPEQRRNLSVPYSIADNDFNPCVYYNFPPSQLRSIVQTTQTSCEQKIQSDPVLRSTGDVRCDFQVNRNQALVATRSKRYNPNRAQPPKNPPEGRILNGAPLTTTTTTPTPPVTFRIAPAQPAIESRRWVCETQVENLSLNPNYTINAESLTNWTRRGVRERKNGGNNFTNPCRNWTFDRNDPRFYETIVTELGWWCNPELSITIANSVFYIGAIVGGIGIGFIADHRGRVPALVTANLLGCIGGALTGIFYTNFYLFCFFRFITGMAFDNSFTMIYILVLEYVGPTYRTLVANLSIAVFYTIGTLILPWLALAIKNWRIFALAISLPMSLAILAIFIVPESARWLLSKGRTKEATRILRSFARVNRKKVDESIFIEFEEGAQKLYEEFSSMEEDPTLWQAMKKPRIAKNFIFLTIIWALIALVYDGHSRNILNLGDDVFLSFTIASSTEFPADMLLIFTLDRVGRRWMAFGALCLSGGFSLGSAFIPAGNLIPALVMALISRFFVNVAFNIGLQYAAELLPTVIRAQGVNTIHIIGYIASIFSPFIASIGRNNPSLSLTILGLAACISGTCCLFLPETLGEDLPNTLEEGESFGKNQSFWNCPLCAKPKLEEEQPLEATESPTSVELRYKLRASLRGEGFRSSIISHGSRRNTPIEMHMNPGGANPQPRLRRVYTQ